MSPQARFALQRRLAEVAAEKAKTAVNAPAHAVNIDSGAVNKRGAYPNTDERRAYMREKMRARRSANRQTS